MLRYEFINYKIEISKEIVKMGTSFEDILNRMRNAPQNGIPKVTNPNVPSKVERDAAAFAERVKNNPVIPTSSGSQLDEILKRMRYSSHGGMVYADPSFHCNNGLSPEERIYWDSKFDIFVGKMREMKAKRKQSAKNALVDNGTQLAK